MDAAPHAPADATLRRVFPIVGTALVALAVWLFRWPEVAVDWLAPGPLSWLLLTEHTAHGLRQPQTLPVALLSLTLGVALLMAGAAHRRVVAPPAPDGEFSRMGLLALGVALAALALFALAEYTERRSNLLVVAWLLLLATPLALLWRADRRAGIALGVGLGRVEALGLLAAMCAVGAVYAQGYMWWTFSMVGDEYMFYWGAEFLTGEHRYRYLSDIAADRPHANSWRDVYWFDANGVYLDHPLLLSLWQALCLGALGLGNVAWRMSATLISLACLPFLYLWLRAMLRGVSAHPRTSAAVGVGVFYASQLIVVWSLLPQQNNAGLLSIIPGLCLLHAARRRGAQTLYFAAGAMVGGGLLLNILGVLVAAPTMAGLLLIDAVRRWRTGVARAAMPGLLVLAGALTAGAPNLAQPGYHRHLMQKNVSAHQEAETQRGWVKTLQAGTVFLHYRAHSHFMHGNVVDPATALLAALGLGMVWRLRLGGQAWLLLAVSALVTGGMAQYAMAPITRVLLVMPAVALLAAAGFDGLLAWRANWVGRLKWLAMPGAVAVIALAVISNQTKLYADAPYRNYVPFSMLVLQRVQLQPADAHVAIVVPPDYNPYLTNFLLRFYNLHNRTSIMPHTPTALSVLTSMSRQYGPRLAAAARPDSGDLNEVQAAAEAHGGRYYPPVVPYAIPERAYEPLPPMDRR